MQPPWALGRASARGGLYLAVDNDVSYASVAAEKPMRSGVPPQGIWCMHQTKDMAINEAMQEKLDGQFWVKYREDCWSCVAKHVENASYCSFVI